VTVEKQVIIIFTAVSECFPVQITVAKTGFAKSYCHQAMNNDKCYSVLTSFLLSVLSAQKNHLLK
jgi:hypothetical protein